MNADQLAKWQQQLYSDKPLIGSRERRNATQALVQEDSPLAWQAVMQASLNKEEEIYTDVLKVLHSLAKEGSLKTQEKLCQLVIEHDHPMAREIVVEGGYAPRNPCLRAIFYFLTEQWERYEDLDFDQSLLRSALDSYPSLRRRVAQKAKQAGRLSWVKVVTGTKNSQETELPPMTIEEWEGVVALLHQSQQWAEMWQLAQVAPAVWSVRLLSILKQEGWKPRGENPGFIELKELASKCIGEQPILSGITSCRAILPTPLGSPESLILSPDGELLITGSKTIGLWHLTDGTLLSNLEGHKRRISSLAISPDSKTLASASWDKTVRLWQLPEGTPLATLSGHKSTIYSLAITPDGQLLIGGSSDGSVQLWRLDGTLFKTLKGHKGEVNCLAISPDGQYLASGSWDYSIRLWHLASGKQLKVLTGHSNDISCLKISPNGELLVSGSWDKTIRLWRLPDGKALQTLKGHSREVMSLALSPDGKLLASGSRGNKIRLWSLPEGNRLLVLKGHIGSVMSLAISPDGRLLTSGGLDYSVRLWQLPEGTLLSTLEGHHKEITGLGISPDGRLLASASRDKTVRLWTSELNRLSHLPIEKVFEKTLWIKNALSNQELLESDHSWLEFLSGLIRWQRRFDIEVEEIESKLEIGEFDIEIEI